jgi:uncharacterized protein YggT (Ycf19 family)
VSIVAIVLPLIEFYQILILAYVLMSWLRPSTGLVYDIYRTLGTICEPWLGIFRKIIPPLGMMDVSPIVAMISLSIISSLLIRLLG